MTREAFFFNIKVLFPTLEAGFSVFYNKFFRSGYMIAVVQTGGKQYKVSEGDEIQVEKLDAKVGESINLEQVLACGDGESTKVGAPFLEGCSVVCEVTEQFRGKKIIVFKKHRRKNYRRKNGHRQSLTRLKVTGINS